MATEQMTGRERVQAALEGRPVDRLPFSPFLAYVWEYFPEAIREQGQEAFHRMIGADPLWRGTWCPVRSIGPAVESASWEEGGRHYWETRTPVGALRSASMPSESGRTSFLVEHPLKTEEDYKVLAWIEEHTRHEVDTDAMRQIGEAVRKSDGLCLGMLVPRGKSAFQQMVEHYAGTEELNYHLVDFPETVEHLWNVMVRNDLEAVRMGLESGYEYHITWEDSSTQNYSPAQYDKYIGSEIGEWCRILKTAGKKYVQHACGHTRDLVGRMKAHGVAVVESMSPPPTGNLPLKDCRDIAGPDFGIIGGIEPIHLLETPIGKLGAYVEQVIADGRGGPFLLANSDSCPPGVTVEKFKLIADIARASR